MSDPLGVQLIEGEEFHYYWQSRQRRVEFTYQFIRNLEIKFASIRGPGLNK